MELSVLLHAEDAVKWAKSQGLGKPGDQDELAALAGEAFWTGRPTRIEAWTLAVRGRKKATPGAAPLGLAPSLSKRGYRTCPDIASLATWTERELSAVPNFAVARFDGDRLVGVIEWEDEVDLRGVDLDRVVSIEPFFAGVYSESLCVEPPPPPGQGLNRAAAVTFFGTPAASALRGGVEAGAATLKEAGEERIRRMERMLRSSVEASGGEVLLMNLQLGVCSFRVQRFREAAGEGRA